MRINNNSKGKWVVIVKQENIKDDLKQQRTQVNFQVPPPMSSSQGI